MCALLSGAYRVGKRGVARLCLDLFGVPISPAAVCDLQRKTAIALEPTVREALAHVAGKPANVDQTGWQEGTKWAWLWVAVTASVTVFLVRMSRARAVLADLIPGGPGVLTTDRYSAYNHLPVSRREVCWAHLRRDFQAMIDRQGDGAAVGEDLLMHADILLRPWKRVRDGTLTRRGFRQSYLGWIREEVNALLAHGVGCGCAATAGVCRELLAVEPALYTLAAVAGVEPTSNAAERALRHAICWRKTSYGTDSPVGTGSSSGCSPWWPPVGSRVGGTRLPDRLLPRGRLCRVALVGAATRPLSAGDLLVGRESPDGSIRMTAGNLIHACRCPRCTAGGDHPDRRHHAHVNLLMATLNHQQRRVPNRSRGE